MEFVMSILSGLGGSVVCAIAIILFLRDRVENFIDEKIDYEFDKQLEIDKGLIEQKKYVSQHKFDKEFEIMQELMEKAYDFTFLTWDAYITIGNSDVDDEKLKKYVSKCDEFTLYYMRNCAFVPSELIESFDLFVKKINEFRKVAMSYHRLLIKVLASHSTSEAGEKSFQEYTDTMRTIHDELNMKSTYSHDSLVAKTRQYYERLEIK